jgi:hypothetical protein
MFLINLIIPVVEQNSLQDTQKYDKRKFSWSGDRCNNLHNLYLMEPPSNKMGNGVSIGGS